MGIYRRYLFKFLVLFSTFFIISLLFFKSNIGFKYIFRLTTSFFLELKTEEISGNWDDFTLKNINYDIFGTSIHAKSVHVILDVKSLFKNFTIFKEIKIKKLIILLNKNTYNNFNHKNKPNHINYKNILLKYPSVIFQKVHVDKILFKMQKKNIFLFNFSTSIKLVNNNITFFPTYINNIHIESSNINSIEKFKKRQLIIKNSIFNTEKIYSFLSFFSNKKKIFVPLNVNLIFLKCRKISYLNKKNSIFFSIELKAQVKNNILNIDKIKINSSLFHIQSYGKIFFNRSNLISCTIHNQILIPKIYNKVVHFLFKADLNKKIIFKLKFDDFHRFNMNSKIIVNPLDHSFNINLKSQSFLLFSRKNFTLKLKNLHVVLKSIKNNYFVSLKTIFIINDMPSFFFHIDVEGNSKSIFLKKINFFPINKNINIEKNIKYNQYILELIGKVKLFSESDNNICSIFAPDINLNGSVMGKKLSILGSIYYKNFNMINIPGMNLFLGKNKLYLKGFLGNKLNVHSSIYANNLDYFISGLQGCIKSKFNIIGEYLFPVITSKILGKNLNWKNIFLKKFAIFTHINPQKKYSKKIFIHLNKIFFSKFQIDTVHFKTYWNNKKQRFCFFLKNDKIYINLILDTKIDYKTGKWNGFLKEMNIRTVWGKLIMKKSPIFHYNNFNHKNYNFYEKNKDIFSSFLYKTKTFLFNVFNKSMINFQSEIFINTKLQWKLGRKIPNGKIFLIGKNIILEKKKNTKIYYEHVDCVKLSINLIKNNFKSKWIVKKTETTLDEDSISGYLNIIDIYNRKKIEGKFIISNFPIIFINFFSKKLKCIEGMFKGKIKIFGSVYQPKISADVRFFDILITNHNIFKYITLFFPYFPDKIDNLNIIQNITLKQGNILFNLNSLDEKFHNIKWNIVFKSEKILVEIFPKIKVKFSSQLNLNYFLSKYNLIGYIKCFLFSFKINEKNFFI